MLTTGSTGAEVSTLQRRLVEAGQTVVVDGWFGAETERAVRRFQRQHDLMVDGIVGPQTQANLMGRPRPRLLSQTDLEAAALRLDVELAAVMAVTEVESRSTGFIGHGDRPVILYERHVMYRRLGTNGFDAPAIARQHPYLVSTTPGGYAGGAAEYTRLDEARGIDDTSALESCSWGLFQIMGYHWARLGYASVQDFVDAMRRGEADQLDAFVRFIETDRDLHAALRTLEFQCFAAGYNGPAYARNDYDTRLAGAYRRHGRALAQDWEAA